MEEKEIVVKKSSKPEIINNLTEDDLRDLIFKSKCISDMIRLLNLDPRTVDIKLMRKKILQHNLDPPEYKINGKMSKAPDDKLFINGSLCCRKTLKSRILEYGLLDYKCEICGLGSEYNGKKLTLQLDHIDGTNNNNVIENLRFLCPNCHSQTETYTGKQHRIMRICECGTDIWGVYDRCETCYKDSGIRENINKTNVCKCGKIICSDRQYCVKCAGINTRVFHSTKEELDDMINNQKLSYIEIGKRFNVSDNAIKKRCRKLGIDLPKRKNYPKRIPKIDPKIKSNDINDINDINDRDDNDDVISKIIVKQKNIPNKDKNPPNIVKVRKAIAKNKPNILINK
jgi:hypothetical protein